MFWVPLVIPKNIDEFWEVNTLRDPDSQQDIKDIKDILLHNREGLKNSQMFLFSFLDITSQSVF